MTFHNKIYKVILHLSTVNSTVKIFHRFIGTDIVPYSFILRGIHPYFFLRKIYWYITRLIWMPKVLY